MYEITIYLKSGNHITVTASGYEVTRKNTFNTINHLQAHDGEYEEIYIEQGAIEAYTVKEVSDD